MSKHVFFVQLEPDVDHFAPVAYRLNREEAGSVTVISINPLLEIDSDYRLKFLRQMGVEVRPLSDVDGHFWFRLVVWFTYFPAFLLRMVPQRVWNWIYFRIGPVDQAGLAGFFRDRQTRSLSIDSGIPLFRLQPALAAARECEVKVLQLPTANHVQYPPNGSKLTNRAFDPDFHLRVHRLIPEESYLNRTTEEIYLGCMRYCEEWEKINSRLLDEVAKGAGLPSGEGKLKVLAFQRSTKGFLESHSSAEKIRDSGFCELLFRSRPRNLRPRKLYAGTLDALPSALLVKWADVVICSVTSIALDALYYGKPLLYLKYVAPEDVATFEEFGACLKVENEVQLMEALKRLRNRPLALPYPQNNVDKLFTEAVYLGDPKSDVLRNYADFYRKIPNR